MHMVSDVTVLQVPTSGSIRVQLALVALTRILQAVVQL